MVLMYIPCTPKPSTATHSHSWSTGNTGAVSKQYLHTKSYFPWGNNAQLVYVRRNLKIFLGFSLILEKPEAFGK